ncbi:MAG: helix-turn-helix transcriptional regulator [Oscillibacter sp.]|nr:helix-turn-helix transcriptional regulator [Oscillibacter sp.]
MDYQSDKQFGARLRAIRAQRHLTQEQLSAMLQVRGTDLTRSALAKIEAGQRHVYLDELVTLRQILDVSYEELLG